MKQLVLSFWRDQAGASVIPFGLVVAALATAIIVSVGRIISVNGFWLMLK